MVRRSQLAHGALLAVGIALLLSGIFVLGQGEYSHDVAAVGASAPPDSATVLAFDSLSESGQSIVRRAAQSSDGTATVTTSGKVPAFTYGDASQATYVVRDDTTYRVTTTGGGVLADADEMVAYALIGFGAIAALAGGVDLYRHRDTG